MTNAQAAEKLQKVLECTKANKSCRIEEEVLKRAIRALRLADCLDERLETELEALDE